jgi:Lrp/AsnC family leucine-responsive transcriptional regulator
MAIRLDEIDIQLLTELEVDADRTNVELSRLTGLSPAATLHRVRALKESGVIRIVRAHVDPALVGFPLQVFVTASLSRHDPRSSAIFEDHVRALPQVITADNVAGETDYILSVVARDVTELSQVLTSLSGRGGQRLVTYLRLAEVKPPAPLPLGAAGEAGQDPLKIAPIRSRQAVSDPDVRLDVGGHALDVVQQDGRQCPGQNDLAARLAAEVDPGPLLPLTERAGDRHRQAGDSDHFAAELHVRPEPRIPVTARRVLGGQEFGQRKQGLTTLGGRADGREQGLHPPPPAGLLQPRYAGPGQTLTSRLV